jgi:KaiC domain protein
VVSVTEDDDWFERALEADESETESGETGSESNEAGNEPNETGSKSNEAGNESSGTESAEAVESARPESGPSARSAKSDPTGAETEPTDADSGEVGEPTEFDPNPEDAEPRGSGPTDAGPGDGGEFGMGGDSDGGGSSGGGSGGGDGGSGGAGGGFADADPYDGDEDDEELFNDDFASAFENAPGGGMGGEATDDADESFSGGGGGSDAGSGFGGGGGEFGMGSDDGFGGDGPFEDESFDDEEFESSIPRIDIGIEGLDDMIQGGVPKRSLLTTVGSAGTGKTTFGLQFLHEALEQGENAVFITLEESHDRIVSTATEKGWAFDEYEEEGQLAVIDLDPIEMANSLTSIRNDLPRLIEQFGASRLVLDSVSLLEMMYDDQATRRNEVYDFTKGLKEAGVTTMLTSEASEDNAYASRHGIIEYLVDGVFILRYIRGSDDFRETRLAVEIQKIRDANHSREIKPYSITNEGISVYRQANIF